MKTIGIVTYHSSHNYGSVLQAYAMVRTMQKLGLDAKIIDFRHPKTTAAYEFSLWSRYLSFKANLSKLIYRGVLGIGKEREEKFRRFIDTSFPKTKTYTKCEDIHEHFDFLVCGSDQIWNPCASGCNDMTYFLEFDNKNAIKFSYAASSGGQDFCKGWEEKAYRILYSFKRIGVREECMKEYLKSNFDLQSTVNPDPTALLDKEEWEKLEEPLSSIPEKYLLVYSIRSMSDTVEFALKAGLKFNLPVVHINPKNGSEANFCLEGVFSFNNVSPGQFLWLFHHATFIVSNTFHGNMFSVIYRKNFVWYRTNPNDTRMLTLHSKIGLGSSRCIDVDNICDFSKLDNKIDYSSIESNITQFKNEGINYICDIIR